MPFGPVFILEARNLPPNCNRRAFFRSRRIRGEGSPWRISRSCPCTGARDPQAIDRSQEKYGPYCLSIARNILRQEQDAEESVNDTWLGAWNAMPPHRPERLSGFLGKLTRRISLKRWEAARAQKRFGDETALALEELSQCVDGSGDVQQGLEATELAARINDFVLALPQAERRVFLCRYWYLDSVAEIAIRFGFSTSKVKSMLYRIRQQLRQTLDQEGLL